VRVVQGSSLAARSLTFFEDLPAITAAGDDVELYNERGTGWSVSEYNDVINQVVIDAPNTYAHATLDIVGDFDRDSPEVAIPASLVYVTGLLYEDSEERWNTVERANRSNGEGWVVDHGNLLLRVGGRVRSSLDGRSLRVTGLTRPSAMTTDASTTTADPAWVVAQCCFELMLSAIERNPDFERRSLLFAQEAERRRPLVGINLPINAIRVR
jgi:hypothetical protein